jgi:hypothetical protein
VPYARDLDQLPVYVEAIDDPIGPVDAQYETVPAAKQIEENANPSRSEVASLVRACRIIFNRQALAAFHRQSSLADDSESFREWR